MTGATRTIAAGLIAALTGLGCAHQARDGWITLIDGDKGMENFTRYEDANWRAEGGAIVADKGKGGQLVSKKDFKDFEIYAEFWADPTANSGVYMRCADRNKITDKSCYEANIFDQRPDQTFATGGIVHRGPQTAGIKAGGKWNVYEIHVQGSQLTVKLNGVVTSSITNTELKGPGPIALQFGNRGDQPGGAIKWRKVLVREL